MKTDDKTLIEALHILSRDIQSDDGVANACIAEAANRLAELIRDDMVLVPREPTVAMNAEASCVPCGIGGCPPHVDSIYKAMIKAYEDGK